MSRAYAVMPAPVGVGHSYYVDKPQYTIAQMPQCLLQTGALLTGIATHRKVRESRTHTHT